MTAYQPYFIYIKLHINGSQQLKGVVKHHDASEISTNEHYVTVWSSSSHTGGIFCTISGTAHYLFSFLRVPNCDHKTSLA